MVSLLISCKVQCVTNEVPDVHVGELVGDLGPAASRRDEPRVPEDLEVVGEQGLADVAIPAAQRRLQLMDAVRSGAQLRDHSQADLRSQGLEQLHARGQLVLARPRLHGPHISGCLYKSLCMESYS